MNGEQREVLGRRRLNSMLIELIVRLGALAALAYWSFQLVQPFLAIVTWSAILTVALYPVFEWLATALGGRRKLAATLITLVGLLVVIGPATWLGLGVVDGLRSLAARIDNGGLWVPPPPESLRSLPFVGQSAFDFWELASTNLRSAVAQIAPSLKPLGEFALDATKNAGTGAFKFLLSVIIAGFMFAPGPALVRAIKTAAIRIDSKRAEHFVGLAGSTIRTVSRGVIGVSLLQAAVAGLGLQLAGAPGASLLTLCILVLAIIQIGPMLIVVPSIIWSWTELPGIPAFLFTACMLTVTLVDNVLKPLVIARGLTTPLLVIVVGVIGGVLAHGIIGLFVGPVVLAVAWELLGAWLGSAEPSEAVAAGTKIETRPDVERIAPSPPSLQSCSGPQDGSEA
ncbi:MULTISPECIES: AI-2E family transporter [Methylosinus]|uniref:AI-2E family transporter n=1 Tax=Methylosinus trichosporium (strain ATCC 35070 / NCIMB 11131 / UNIQEM 75 / OB3b) TaxID=595536 RepID=A0A2D2CUP3_METT3|nr:MULTISPECIES: AI-2E family transporter [Methylosinus]ATQ66572.1 AI-2E family transporter [Methylosinus trichosporium OB3b]